MTCLVCEVELNKKKYGGPKGGLGNNLLILVIGIRSVYHTFPAPQVYHTGML